MTRRLGGLIGLALVWELAARYVANPMFIPFSRILPAWGRLVASGEILEHLRVSLVHVSLGFTVAVMIGFLVAVWMAHSAAVHQIITPLIDFMRPVAALTIFPLVILLLGIGTAGKVFVIFWTAWPAVVLNTYEGLTHVDASVIEAARLDGATDPMLLRYIKIPLASSTILTGLRIGLSGGWISLVAAEMLGSSRGLGYATLAYSQTFRFPEMYAIILTIALAGLGMNVLLSLVQKAVYLHLDGDLAPSRFFRYGDRAASYGIDNFRLEK